MTDAPREFEGWTLFPADGDILPIYHEMGLLATKHGVWEVAHTWDHLRILLLTDLPHPDNPKIRAIYSMRLHPYLLQLRKRLTGGDAP